MVQGARQHAAYYHSRERVRGLRDPSLALYRTHDLGVVQTTLDADAVLGSRDRPITFATTIEITGASAAGVICEFGGATIGTLLTVTGGTFELAAGAASGDGGVNGEIAIGSLGTAGARHRIVLAINPRAGKARLWVNGALVLRLTGAQAFDSNVWAADANGAIGAAVSGDFTGRTLTDVATAPNDFALVEPFLAFVGQLPRQFG